jgi:hypothetical protein
VSADEKNKALVRRWWEEVWDQHSDITCARKVSLTPASGGRYRRLPARLNPAPKSMRVIDRA